MSEQRSVSPAAPSIGFGPDPLPGRQLEIAREIGAALRGGTHLLEVCRLALARLTPLVRARFSSVFLRDPEEPQLLRLACAHRWPQSSARHLARVRVRVGRGPTGRAAAERAVVEVEDVFSVKQAEWHGPARELGFASMIAVPLMTGGTRVEGTLSFYFREPHRVAAAERALLVLVARAIAEAAAKNGA